ncbi:MAG: hypothetical protein OEZ06_31380 [Myxococcales bacterium]|nr:hypothetical protein [Myxococcales bacterium]
MGSSARFRNLLRSLATVALVGAAPARAQTPEQVPVDSSIELGGGDPDAPRPWRARVALKDGRRLEGVVVVHVPGSHAVMRLDDGRDVILSAAVIEAIVPPVAPEPASKQGSAPTPAPEPAVPKPEPRPHGYFVLNTGLGGLRMLRDVDAYGGFLSGGVRGALGSRLPDASGGFWSGIGYDLSAQATYTVSYARVFTGINLGVSLGWSALWLGALDGRTHTQRGFGWMLGARFGGHVPISGRDSSASYGPMIALSLAQYDATSARLSELNLSCFVLETGGMTLVMVQLGVGI